MALQSFVFFVQEIESHIMTMASDLSLNQHVVKRVFRKFTLVVPQASFEACQSPPLLQSLTASQLKLQASNWKHLDPTFVLRKYRRIAPTQRT